MAERANTGFPYRALRKLERALDPAIAETLALSGLDVSEIHLRLGYLSERIGAFRGELVRVNSQAKVGVVPRDDG